MATRRVRCDPKAVEDFDYSGLSPDFSALGKPARRALVNNGILTPKDLAKRTLAEIREFHGMGPSSIPKLRAALKKRKLDFKRG